MNIAILQFEPTWRDPAHNITQINDALAQRSFDLIVLPELCNSGYLFASKDDLRRYSEVVPEGATTQALIDIARSKHAFIVAGVAEQDGDRLYDTAVVIGPHGYLGKHRKRHFSALEARLFNRGESAPAVFDMNGVTVGVLICFESWFPEACRSLVRQSAQVICSPANFGGAQSLTIGRARAIENGVFFVTANRTGAESLDGFDAHFRGHSQIVAPNGDLLAKAQEAVEFCNADIDPRIANTGTMMGIRLADELSLYP